MLNMRSIKYDMKKEEKHNNLLNLSATGNALKLVISSKGLHTRHGVQKELKSWSKKHF